METESIANDNADKLKDEPVVSEEMTNTPENEVAPAEVVSESVSAPIENVQDAVRLRKTEIVEQLEKTVTKNVTETVCNEVDLLKQSFYKTKRIEIEAAKKQFIEAGHAESEFIPETDALENKLKDFLAVFREKKAVYLAEVEKIREQNLIIKKDILEKLRKLIETQGNFDRIYNEFRKLQQQWREVKQVPQGAANNLWKDYQYYNEKFYDLRKINDEMRNYDFKKNLEAKQALCEAVERLSEEKDAILAAYQLQKLRQEWKEIGPVARNVRDEIWERFQTAAAAINKNQQAYFNAVHESERRNLDEKTAICEEVENIDYSTLNSYADWHEQTKKIIKLQQKWKTIGRVPKRRSAKIYERFRTACDVFFQKRNVYYESLKDTMEANLEKRKALCEAAEALKDSVDWTETSDRLTALRKEWKAAVPVARKDLSNILWKRFSSACDYFFGRRSAYVASQKTDENDNLKQKEEIVAQIKSIDETLSTDEAAAQLREHMTRFRGVKNIAGDDKRRINQEFRAAVDEQLDRLKINHKDRRLHSSAANQDEPDRKKPKGKNPSERRQLMISYGQLKSKLLIYENNIGYFSVSSKSGSGLLKDLQQKIEDLKGELRLIEEKIEAIDRGLNA